ncbi:Acg family FMN-binding oxidoreductase [Dactylosporangium salmoneum]|uniref:NAD(P)H nitroreductase n=1 Tax=Dactylosporangium salmoneum TaxID=53361 RepID=A0ABP5U1P3_9ACTN
MIEDTQTATLHLAADEARRAPSILNTQPWRWQVHDGALDLHADPARRLGSVDPQGRLLTLSCGAALHHARVALAAAGHEPVVERLPDPADPSLLARVRAGRPRPAGDDDRLTYEAMLRRRTDRRRFGSPVPMAPEALAALRAAAEAEHARLHRLRPGEVEYLGYAAQGAHVLDAKDEGRVAEQQAWTHRGPGSADGMTGDAVPAPADRPVPLRDFALGGEATLDPGPGDESNVEYLAVVTDGDGVEDWLAAGEATSAVWLAAVARGLAASPLSDVVEIPGARALLGSLIEPAGHPQLVLRVGVDPDPAPPPASPRRPARDVIDGGEATR